ncbi:hypothetical protein CAEBREN_14497 [Caenorhabditis brenneri]|uniref:Uncharacterized protein n=1 Tax=Caenorhabditis brenneri TaxID=135651 RepID=G0P1U9_CAEBE|nr:hypothetical protein CAEBREN_14497 [Caenorhabditis brenneri]
MRKTSNSLPVKNVYTTFNFFLFRVTAKIEIGAKDGVLIKQTFPINKNGEADGKAGGQNQLSVYRQRWIVLFTVALFNNTTLCHGSGMHRLETMSTTFKERSVLPGE